MVILRLCGSFFANYVFYDFFKGQLEPRITGRKRIFLVLLLCAVVMRGVNSFGSSLVNLIFGPIILLGQILLLYKDDGRKEVFLLFIGESVTLFMELMTALFFSRLPLWGLLRESIHYDQEIENFMMGILSYLLCWMVLRGLKIYFLNQKTAMREQFPLSFFLLPLSTSLIYIGVFFGGSGDKWAEYSLNLGYLFLPGANILLFYTIHKLFFISEKSREQQLAEQQTVLQQRYYKHLEEIDRGHRRYAHELKNCMASIGALAAAGGNEEIIALLGDMEIELDVLTGKHYTPNSILNALLWEKSALSKRRGVRMDIEAEPDEEWNCVQGRDLIVMVGNLLDNAIEAAEKCPKGSVHVALYSGEHFLVTEVENTCMETLYGKGEKVLSTKPDAVNHGFGIANVRAAAEKYGGVLYTERKDGHFTAVLTIAKACLVSS